MSFTKLSYNPLTPSTPEPLGNWTQRDLKLVFCAVYGEAEGGAGNGVINARFGILKSSLQHFGITEFLGNVEPAEGVFGAPPAMHLIEFLLPRKP
jgi:hypothetical protein